jgi:hypothetical protein
MPVKEMSSAEAKRMQAKGRGLNDEAAHAKQFISSEAQTQHQASRAYTCNIMHSVN